MSTKNRPNPRNFFIVWAIFGICVVLLSFHMTAGPYAKYSSQSTGSDGARVAKFDVASKEKNGVALSIDLDFFDPEKQSDHFEFEVSSSSEVALKYDVVLILPEKMAELVSDGTLIAKMDGSISGTLDAASKTLTFTGGSFAPASAELYSHEITIEISPDTMPLLSLNITEPVTLRIHAEQID